MCKMSIAPFGTIWNIAEIVNEREKASITNELLKNNNNYYKINTSDLVKDETLLK